MTIKRSAILIVLVVSLASCSNRQNGEVSVKEDLTAKQLLQGTSFIFYIEKELWLFSRMRSRIANA